jgi:hypothetical protein
MIENGDLRKTDFKTKSLWLDSRGLGEHHGISFQEIIGVLASSKEKIHRARDFIKFLARICLYIKV